MKSRVAEEVRAAQQADALALSPAERLELALALGVQAVEDFARNRGITYDEALRVIRRGRRAGRRYSRCIEELDEGVASR